MWGTLLTVIDAFGPRRRVQGKTRPSIGKEAIARRIGRADVGVIDVWLLNWLAATHDVWCMLETVKLFVHLVCLFGG